MIPVHQDLFYDPALADDQQRGNCYQAALASLLELPLNDVPNFVGIDVAGGENWWTHSTQWLYNRGYDMYYWPIEDENNPLEPAPDEHYLISGKSPRGNFYHVAVYLDGNLAHDPHPSGAGILTEEDVFLIRRRDD